jgi:predicted RNA polymerase sigma factor
MDRRARGDGLIVRAERGPDGVEELVRSLVPQVLAGLLRRREAFAAAEDAVQDATVDALRVWPDHPPRDPRAWLTTVAMRRLVDARRSESARRRREDVIALAPGQGPTEQGDDTLVLLFCCCHPELSPASQVALTLRAVGGLTTREISSEAIRLTRQLTLATPEPEARGLLALMLLQHARLPARTDAAGRLVTLDEQDRSLWDTDEIAEAVAILQGALAEQRPGRYQILAAIAALHADASTAAETDWTQILAWYDDLVALSETADREDPAAVLNRAIAVGHVAGAAAGLAETERVASVLGDRDQWFAVRAYLSELGGDFAAAGEAYAAAAERANELAERDHLVRRAARARAAS